MALLVLLTLALLGQTVTAQECINDEIRTVTSSGNDYIQYCVSGEWRLHCNGDDNDGFDLWRDQESNVACRQLGYSGVIPNGGPRASNPGAALTTGFFRFGAQCVGTESSIRECGGDVQQLSSCDGFFRPQHGVAQCQAAVCTNGEIRLVNGSTNREGRVEVCVDGRWGTVCNNQEGLAGAICAQLGFPAEGAQLGDFAPRAAPTVICPIQSVTVRCTSLQEFEDLIINRTISETLQNLMGGSNMRQPAQQSSNSAVIALGIIVALLVVLLVIAIIGWIITGLKLSRKSADIESTSDDNYVTLHNRSGPFKKDNSTAGVHFTPKETTIPRNNSVEERRYHKPKPTTQAKPAHFTPVGASKKGADFYDAEEHTYAMVDKKAKKKAQNNDETEEDSHVYDTAMDGETSWGVQEGGEEYSKLQR